MSLTIKSKTSKKFLKTEHYQVAKKDFSPKNNLK